MAETAAEAEVGGEAEGKGEGEGGAAIQGRCEPRKLDAMHFPLPPSG